ncbi:Aste57867_18103 [Aphanomyces stellatus]|uniref:Coronin n=1 Tax=Aphanomyces stellatus TaxID=120398 RepID=A0A485L961_9STRA|nr:hypothetical protein As57867_018041 [Aphanomyces stellatus]VFT94841.1 Aste57867_18103 [Aphanomyces stellatus]
MFRASKYRNVLGTNLPREEWYEELQMDGTRLDLYPVAATESHLAFVSQLNSGASIEIKLLNDKGKANALQKPPSLLRGHTQRVNSLEFYPFDTDSKSLLASGGDDCSVKIWNVSQDIESSDCLWTYNHAFNSKNVALSFHPSASNVLGAAFAHSVEVLNIESQSVVGTPMKHPDLVTGISWKADGSVLVSVCQDNNIRAWDPRLNDEASLSPGHQGRKPANITWCKDEMFFTAGFNNIQERELMLWDLRKMEKPLARERVDSGTGLLIPVFDEDTNLLFLSGRGDKIVRTYEVAFQRPFFASLQQSTFFRPTWGMAKIPKRACALDQCEVDRLLSVSQSSIESLSFTVPRKESQNQFQADLYPDSRINRAALTSAEWIGGNNIMPLVGKVEPPLSFVDPPVTTFQDSISWNSGGGWGDVALTTPIVENITEAPISYELSEKAKKLGSIQGNKFKYVTGKPLSRSECYLNVPSDGNVLIANETHWATTVLGTGGPVMIQPLDHRGKVENAHVINGHKSAVTDMEFHPFSERLLATASDDCVVQIWDLSKETPESTLVGHEKGVRCVSFHPSAENILATGSMDSTIRLWDLTTSQSKQEITKFEDSPFNIAFNYDGSLFATITRDKVLRVIDPRSNKTVSMSCAHEGAKTQKVLWCSQNKSSTIMTVGFNGRSERQLYLWDSRNLLDPLTTTTIDTSGSILLPFYDESSSVIYLVGRGDRSLLTYEIESGKLQPCSPFSFNGPPIAAAAVLPKRCCNIKDVEVARLLLLTKTTIEPISFSLPRAEKLKNYFQDDIYGVVRDSVPCQTSESWFSGENRDPRVVSLQPPGMPLLSEREIEAPVVPKVVDFKAQKQREDEEKKTRDEQFQRLHALAYQPTLHSQRNPRGNADNDDEEDGWDD